MPVVAVPVGVVLVASLFAAIAVVVATPDDVTQAAASTVPGANGAAQPDGPTATTGPRTDADAEGRADDVDEADAREPELTGPLGVIVAGDGPTSSISSQITVAPVSLEPVEGPAPVVVPPSEPNDVDVLEGPASSGGLDVAAAGSPCQIGCITRATLHRELRSTDIRIHMETSVKTRMWVGVFEDAPLWINGSPVVDDAITRGLHLPRTTWEPSIGGLAPDTTYHVIVRARDSDGNNHYESTDFTTVTPIEVADTLVATPSGCLYQCIASGTVEAISHDAALLRIETSAPATLGVWVSTSEPGWIGGSPILPASAAIPVPGALQSSWNVPAGGLDPETTYHVVVRVTDAEGRFSSRVGQFTTAEEPATVIEVTFESIIVSFDGDAGDDDGELGFGWGFGSGALGLRSTASHGDGDVVTISSSNTAQISVPAGGVIPPFFVSATEWDRIKKTCLADGTLAPFHLAPHSDNICNTWTNVATSGLMSLETIAQKPSCASYGVIGEREGYPCVLLTSDDLGSRYPHVTAVVSVRVL